MDLANTAQMGQDKWIKHQRRKRQKHLVTDLLFDYAKNSTLHGLRYISERRLTTLERIFWLATFIVSLSLCGYHISKVYTKWRTSPVIVTVSEKMIPVGLVPFPSVTICPQIKSKVSVYNFTNASSHVNLFTDEERAVFDSVTMICKHAHHLFDSNYTIINDTIADENYIQTIIDVSPTIEDTILGCKWVGFNGSTHECRNLFRRVLTVEGVCFNFNSLSSAEIIRDSTELATNITERDELSRGWTPERGYDDSERNPFPFRGKENSAAPDLQVWLQTDPSEIDGLCNGDSSGFKIYLHDPKDLPQSSLYYYAAIDNQVSSIAVNLNVLNTLESLRFSYTAEERQCYFSNEKYLHFFKIYTAKNCRIECLTNITLEKCKCVGYYMPRNTTTHICRLKNEYCMIRAHEEMVARELRYDPNMKNDRLCRCLPACDSVEYDAEILKTNYNRAQFAERLFKTEYNWTFKFNFTLSKIDIYFKKPEYISMRRSELFGWTDFVANIGGLLGVFLGFSFLSLVELLYFLTLRIGFTLKHDLKEEKNKNTLD